MFMSDKSEVLTPEEFAEQLREMSWGSLYAPVKLAAHDAALRQEVARISEVAESNYLVAAKHSIELDMLRPQLEALRRERDALAAKLAALVTAAEGVLYTAENGKRYLDCQKKSDGLLAAIAQAKGGS